MTFPDPRQLVEAPIRSALASLTARGIALVVVTVALVLCAGHHGFDVATRDALSISIPCLLLAVALVGRGRRILRGRPDADARDRAWTRARDVDEADAALALMTAAWVPVAIAVALAVMLWPHMTDPNPGLAAAWVVLGLPPILLAWLFLTTTWLEMCRDDLAVAEGEADARYRRYWADLRR